MLIWITNILKAFLFPPGCLILLALLGGWLIQRGKQIGLKIIYTVIAAWYILSMPITADTYCNLVETIPPLQEAKIAEFKPQAIVVLAGGIVFHAPEFQRSSTVNPISLERARYAARLAKLTHLPILAAGGRVYEQDQPAEAEALAGVLREFGVTPQWLESNSRNTLQNAQNSFKILDQAHINRVILVTHAMHMPRAYANFKASGFEVLPAPTRFISGPSPINIISFLPNANALFINSSATMELVGALINAFKQRFQVPVNSIKPNLAPSL